ncbi:MAG: dihydroxyacetone kinase phosphoryl donor subunit DhaM [Pseudoclavibacter sp.]|nr:dihydroxyacetone kinase phosphoryl donor subunit DhaM [Pseudoclavibacter sp.]
MSTGIVVVSHSADIAAGVVELAGQMAQGVRILAAGGTEDGGIGTSYERIEAACRQALAGGGRAVILCDLGSAVMTSELFLDTLEGAERERLLLVDAPLVEGAVAAGVQAAAGGSLAEVAEAARGAGGGGAQAAAAETAPTAVDAGDGEAVRRRLRIVNPSGLHARPAAALVKRAAGFDARITIDGADAKSLLSVMGLGVEAGAEVLLSATGPQARQAVDAIAALVEEGFGESPA